MHDRMQQAFDTVRAEDALKDKTKAFVAEQIRARARRRTALRPSLAVAFACLCLLFTGGYWLYFTPTATISIDINPSIELGVNRFNRVVTVEGYNADGEALASALSIQYADYNKAVNQVLANETVSTLLDGNGVMTITVIGPEGAQRNQILADMERCTAGRQNAYCYAMRGEDVEQAHELGLSYGKYRAFLEVQALDPEVTPQEIQNMSMREIRDLLNALRSESGEGQDGQFGQQRGPGHGGGYGQGNQKKNGASQENE